MLKKTYSLSIITYICIFTCSLGFAQERFPRQEAKKNIPFAFNNQKQQPKVFKNNAQHIVTKPSVSAQYLRSLFSQLPRPSIMYTTHSRKASIMPSHIDTATFTLIQQMDKEYKKSIFPSFGDYYIATWQTPAHLWLQKMKKTHGEQRVLDRIEHGDLQHEQQDQGYQKLKAIKSLLSYNYDTYCLMIALCAYLPQKNISSKERISLTNKLMELSSRYFILPSINPQFPGNFAARTQKPAILNSFDIYRSQPARATNHLFSLGLSDFPTTDHYVHNGETAWGILGAGSIGLLFERKPFSRLFKNYRDAYYDEAIRLFTTITRDQMRNPQDLNFGGFRMGPKEVDGQTMNFQNQWIIFNSENSIDIYAACNLMIYIGTKRNDSKLVQYAKMTKQNLLWWFANVAWDTKRKAFTRGFDNGSLNKNGTQITQSQFQLFHNDSLLYTWDNTTLEQHYPNYQSVPITYSSTNKPCVQGKEITQVKGYSATDANTWLLAALTKDDRIVLESMVRQRWDYPTSFKLDEALYTYVESQCIVQGSYKGKTVVGAGYHENDTKVSPEWTYGWVCALLQLSHDMKNAGHTQKAKKYYARAVYYMKEMEKMRSNDASMPYASEQGAYIDHGWWTPPQSSSIIGPLWHMMMTSTSAQMKFYNPFLPPQLHNKSLALQLPAITDYCSYYANLCNTETTNIPVSLYETANGNKSEVHGVFGHAGGENWYVQWRDYTKPITLEEGSTLEIQATSLENNVTAKVKLVDTNNKEHLYSVQVIKKGFYVDNEGKQIYLYQYKIPITKTLQIKQICLHSGKMYYAQQINPTQKMTVGFYKIFIHKK